MRWRDLLEIAVFVAVVVGDALGIVPITQTIFLVPLIALALRLRRERWAMIGWYRPASWKRAIAIGVVAGIAMEMLAVHVTTPLISGWFGVEPDYSQFRSMQGNVAQLLLFLALSWTVAALGEEICFRGFLMQRLARVFGGSTGAWLASLFASSVLFGCGHTEQGVSGWIQEGLSGLLLGALFLANRRCLAVPVIAHGVSNSVAFVLIFLGRYPGVG
jgi:uncharacterized protein